MMMVAMLLNMGALTLLFSTFSAQRSVFCGQSASAQIKIGGSVYGGGNKGNVKGSTKVTVTSGDVNKVFGGARMANVGGNAYVNIDGQRATGYTVINYVYGGNDISGNIGTASAVGESLPSEIKDNTDGVDNTWNTYVHLSTKTKEEDAKKTYIGQLFAGGNGDYYYTSSTAYGKTTHSVYTEEGGALVESMVTDEGATGFHVPELAKTYLDIQGGSIVYAYGGGNKATVTEQTVIHVDNPSKVVNEIWVDENGVEVEEGGTNLLTPDRFRNQMGINTGFSKPSSDEFQIGRLFGGNNLAEMSIMPTWNLQSGKIRNLYSGGNRGMMTSPKGLLLEIPANSSVVVDNVYGGCRMADVKPTVNGAYTPVTNLSGYNFPNELSARVLIRGGDINNVYGGNDVTGTVYGGNAVGVYTSIRGDVYGGGNGAYPYTDTPVDILDADIYGDLNYYSFLGDYTTSYEALNAFRPNAEQVSIRLAGTEEKPTVIHGSVFCGGNCATLSSTKSNPLVELKIGSYVIADNVFLGNNGAGMVEDTILQHYAGKYPASTGDLIENFSSLKLKDGSVFEGYMEGVAMTLQPDIVFDADYKDFSSYIGSFYCGGNVGSMAIPGKSVYRISRGLNIYDKFVGGCNNANVTKGTYNAPYEGGVLGSSDEGSDYTGDRLEIDLDNLNIVPLRWDETKTKLIWNTNKWDMGLGDFKEVSRNPDDSDIRLLGGNVYGGCYNSGHVNGNVVININEDVLKKDEIFASANASGPYGRASGVKLEDQRDDLMAVALSVFGAGYGADTEIWGSTTVNLNNGYAFQVYGGGDEGVVGKKNSSGEYEYNAAYSTTVNLKGTYAGYSEEVTGGAALAETEYIYGGGNEGNVCGNSYVYLGNGRVYDAFGGASNADILGGTEVHIGYNGFPWVRDNVYGGNDFGGTVKGSLAHSDATSRTVFDSEMLQSSTYVKYIQGRVDSIFGGNYGNYNYKDRLYRDYTDADGSPKDGFSFPRLVNNSFVHFEPADNSDNQVGYIFGGSMGFAGNNTLNNTMQQESYVLIDDTKTKDDDRYAKVDIYGGGAFAGVGTAEALGAGRTAVDLFAGSFNNVYGGSNREGLIGYTRVNVPAASIVKVNSIFGGGKGYEIEDIDETPSLAARYCDNYVTCIDYKGASAIVKDAIYGGNQNCRIACDTYINIEAPVMQSSGYQATIYGAGYGRKTISGRTNIFMNERSNAYKVFGGGRDGNAFNFASMSRWLYNQSEGDADEKAAAVTAYRGLLNNFSDYLDDNPISLPTNIGTYVNATTGQYDGKYTNDILPTTEEPMPSYHNTNVHIMPGGNVSGYAYGGGLGDNAVVGGTTYVELKGGNVDKDIYGGGQGGPVYDEFGLKTFTATTNVNIESGMVRNVYGGGYLGHVGKHEGDISASNANDIPAVANVVIGKTGSNDFSNGKPAILRNVYGGGEGGSLYGTANVTINNGMIGYRYKNKGTAEAPQYDYVEELDDQKTNDIELSGNVFGGGYVVNSYVDVANVNMYGGTIRGSLYGGGEVGPIGRGTMKSGATTANGGIKNGPNDEATIYKAGQTHVKMYNGHVLRNVFGGGRGKDSWGGDGTMYMSNVSELDLKCKGYVFGQTDVCIYGGEVGTDAGMAQNFGNVFGGGDEGSVYSAYEDANGNLFIGKKDGTRYDGTYEGYYYKWDPNKVNKENTKGDFVTQNVASEGETEKLERNWTEDCKVLVEPWLQVKNNAVTYDGKTYPVGSYVPTAYLNTLKAKIGSNDWPDGWENVDVGTGTAERGVIIHNAVFAGGNIAAGSNTMYANETTVFGNATASIHDIYNRDLITIGTGHTGGLYGDGNLTFVDGYRGLNITNYGTDYNHLQPTLSIAQYNNLPKREKDYYEPKYKCLVECTDIDGTTYKVGTTMPLDELLALFVNSDGTSLQHEGKDVIVTVDGKKVPNPDIWEENGVVSTYAGRIMNTIQRADFCGVFGSRMVMKGARDRVPEIVDYTNYTINRVREVSLNKKDSPAGDTDDANKLHGNYFGIYSIVNYLGALTSDVDFHSVRTTNSDLNIYENLKPTTDGETFAQWKELHKDDRTRNNGNCHNQLALASGVYLELTTEKSTGNTLDKKDWGLITGVVELDLINVQPGIDGGFVYAKNQHGVRSATGNRNTTLTALNENAVTQWDFKYDPLDANKQEWQTSGNFIHSSQTIIDDCYNVSGKYLGTDAAPAHYWFISGLVYVYDQYISAYTGAPNAYSKTVEIPITINAASNGTMTLMDVQPNYYAYYSSYTNETTNTKLSGDAKLVINDVSYQLNDPISYWDWNKLSASEKKLFVNDTYVTVADCKVGSDLYPAGTVMRKGDYDALKVAVADGSKTLWQKKVDDDDNVTYVTPDENFTFDYVFRSSNNLGHDTGYILTYNMNNPADWNPWYTKVESSTREKNQQGGSGYEDGPTYHPTEDGLYGQKEYAISNIIPASTYATYQGYDANGDGDYDDEGDIKGVKQVHPEAIPSTGQATFVPAYVVTEEYTDATRHYYPGAPISENLSGYSAPAYVCTSTIQLSESEFIYINELMTEDEKTAYYNRFKDGSDADKLIAQDIKDMIVPAYYCTVAGLYGGDYYETGKNYRGLAAWSSLSAADRKYFEFNYDALDLLIDPAFVGLSGRKYQYDAKAATLEGAQANDAHYSLPTRIDYTATYKGATDPTAHNGIKLTNGEDYTREDYEALPNEQRHYAPISVKQPGDYYVVNEGFVHIETPYAAGAIISKDNYDRLFDDEKVKVTTLSFTDAEVGTGSTYYFCRENYKIDEKGEGKEVESVKGVEYGSTFTSSTTGGVPVGVVISEETYKSLPNYQKNFAIHGVSPMETSTLFVGRNSDINDLSKEKIITVVYKYDYEESDANGLHITPVSERHVVNIHITFKSGVPTVEDIQQPSVVLPGTGITMRVPNVTPGAYEVLGGGWELFEKESYAESHTNGVEYAPTTDPLYWYQDGFYLAYYAKTYLGKTYSNHVPVSVANYHDLKAIMDDTKNHLHVDYDRTRLKRDSKIYINDYSGNSQNGLDLLKNFYDLSVLDNTAVSKDPETGIITEGRFKGHAPLNNSTETGTNIYDRSTNVKGVKAGTNLEFFLRSDISHTDEWTPIASGDDPCFNGTLHGDGHTLSGLTGSLFGKLCGSVYNLGVTGSFTSAGVADTGDGYVESCWINTTGTPDGSVYAVFGEPTDEEPTTQQIVNSYYQSSKNYKTTASTHGLATPMADHAFYDGEVAYNLNNFYLYKRYCDKAVTTGTDAQRYSYYTIGDGNKLVLHADKYYTSNPTACSSGYNGLQYVENRFADGDFRFAAGSTSTRDERNYVETITDTETNTTKQISHYYPIWPDDYLFFGQKLTFGYSTTAAHQSVPTAIVKDGGRLSQNADANRVYRAPAYYQSSVMGTAYFNPDVYLAQTQKDNASIKAYPNMTAIDFAGHQGANRVNGTYALGSTASGLFYPPLLDDDGLRSIINCDQTRNLLVYAPAAESENGYANKKTHDVLAAYFTEPAYADSYDNTDGYRLVGVTATSGVYGHLVQGSLTATNDHLLVDKQDFNAPIAYRFIADSNEGTHDGTRMWYQRMPANYVDRSTGWEGISIPFEAELVTTNQKGEITHFYSGSESSANSDSKIGHEYWLREYRGIKETTGTVATATLRFPDALAPTEANEKKVTNTFLWDYYYEAAAGHAQKDAHGDTYQTYYNSARTYAGYPRLQGGTPYVIGFPGQRYYEFDLSGNFEASTTASPYPAKLSAQTITFASAAGAAIGVSDAEGGVTADGYTFRPNFLKTTFDAGTADVYSLSADGGSYKIVPGTGDAVVVDAFRPYFVKAASARSVKAAEQIVFGQADTSFGVEENGDPSQEEIGEGLSIFARKRKIVVKSNLRVQADVSIYSTSGAVLGTFTIEPGQTVESPVLFSGVYLVRAADGRFVKKLSVD